MRAAFFSEHSISDLFLPSGTDVYPLKPLHISLNISTDREGCVIHGNFHSMNEQVEIQSDAQTELMNRFMGINTIFFMVGEPVGFGVQQVRFDFPEAVRTFITLKFQLPCVVKFAFRRMGKRHEIRCI